MSISTERSDHGLTVEDTIRQSRAIHPDWDLDTQFSYLVNDAFFSKGVALEGLGITDPAERMRLGKMSIFPV